MSTRWGLPFAWSAGTLALVAACSSSAPAPLGGSASDAAPASTSPTSAVDAATPHDASSSFDASTIDASVLADASVLPTEAGPFACTADPSFPTTVGLAEASAVTEVELSPGVRELLIVSDSGNGGAALLVPLSGAAPHGITLPLDGAASDDLEGIAWRNGALYTLTSSGAVRRFVPDGAGGLVRDQDAYALGPAPYACANLGGSNCGPNYEGLCLRPPSSIEPCVGYAASRADGKLYCLALDAAGVLSADVLRAPLDTGIGADKLSDCAFGTASGPGEHALVIASNVYNASRAYRMDETTGAKTQLPTAFLLNLESITIDHDGALYTLSDDNSKNPSPAAKLRCTGW